MIAGLLLVSAYLLSPARGSEYSHIISCEEGWVSDGSGMCRRDTSVVAEAVCEKGSEAVMGGCALWTEVDPLLLCGDNFGSVLTGGRCMREEIVASIQSCSKSEELIDGFCIGKKGEGKKKKSCLEGYRYIAKEDICVKSYTTEGMPTCDPGFVLDTKKGSITCIRVDLAPPESFCHKGEFLNGQCIEIDSKKVAKHECPDGYKYHSKEHTCLKHNYIHPDKRCGTGSDNGKGKCLHTEIMPAIPMCKKNFTLNNNLCELREISAPEFTCPKGSGKGDGKGHNLDTSGRLGSHNNHSVCTIDKIVEPIVKCSDGMTPIDGKHCLEIEYAQPSLDCPKDYTSMNGKCLLTKTEKAKTKCPPHYKLKEGACYRKSKKQSYLSCSQYGPEYKLQDKECVALIATNPIVSCHKGELMNNKCIISNKKKPKSKCPKGFKLKHGICTQTKNKKTNHAVSKWIHHAQKFVQVHRNHPTQVQVPKGIRPRPQRQLFLLLLPKTQTPKQKEQAKVRTSKSNHNEASQPSPRRASSNTTI